MSGKPMTRGQVKQGEKRKADEQRKEREQKRFSVGKVIGRNDLIVNPNVCKVKIEQDYVAVKKEVDVVGEGSAGNEVEQQVIIVEEVVDIQTDEQEDNVGHSGGQCGESLEESEHLTPLQGIEDEVILSNRDPLEENEELRRENQLLKQKMKEMELQIQELQKTPFVKPLDVCPPGTEENNHNSSAVARKDSEEDTASVDLDLNEDIGGRNEDTPEERNDGSANGTENVNSGNPGEMLKYLGMQKCSEEFADPKKEEEEIISGKVLPILCTRGYLKLNNSLLNSRLVCKNWHLQVDNFLENPISLREFDKSGSQLQTRRIAFKALPDVSKSEMDKLEKYYTFYYTSTLKGLLKKFENFEGNPFLGRIAQFHVVAGHVLHDAKEPIDDLVEMHRYWEWVAKLLEKFGHQLWYVTIYQRHFELSPLELYKILEKCFPHLKNVKCLTVYGKYEDVCLRKEKPSKLDKYMAKNHLPVLPNLRELNFEFPTVAIYDAILQISPVLTTLTVMESRVGLKDIAKSVGKLELKELWYVTRPRDYQNLSCVSKDLEKLELDFSVKGAHSAGKLTKVGLGELLVVLKGFPKLSELKLKGIISVDVDGENLQNLSVETLELLNCYDDMKEEKGVLEDLYKRTGFYAKIMSHFPNLRFLNIKDKRQANTSTPLIMTDYSEGFEWEFNVWNEFKFLKAIDLETTYQFASDSKEKTSTRTRNKNPTLRMSWRREVTPSS